MSRSWFLVPVLAVGACARPATPPDPQMVGGWLRTSLAFVRSERVGPPVAARISAYSSLALYEGYAADSASGLRSLGGQLNGLPSLPSPKEPVDGATAAAAAEQVVMDSLFRDGYASTRRTIDSLAGAQIARRRSEGVGRRASERSVAHGRALGAAILAWAARDGFFDTRGRDWRVATAPGKWVNTTTTDQFVPQLLSGESDVVLAGNPASTLDPATASSRNIFTNRPKVRRARTTLPAFDPLRPTEPYWGTLRPFVLRNGDECAPPPALPYSEQPGSPFWAMARELYDSTRALTPHKREVALFWADNPVATGTPGFHWISVVNQMIPRRQLRADQAAELYALTSLAIADAFIGCWQEKYRSMVVRPIAYLPRAFDRHWLALVATPPFPEYPSGHSTISAAAARVLIAQLGDSIPFVDSTQVDIGFAPRPFPSFSAARNEVAVSRVYAGIHYVRAVVNGIVQGECISERLLHRLVTRPPAT